MSGSPPAKGVGLTVDDFLSFLAPYYWQGERKALPAWPPDMFAIVASLLRRSGAYRHVVQEWPPDFPAPDDEEEGPQTWEEWVRDIGTEWRITWREEQDIPAEVKAWWGVVVGRAGLPLSDCCSDPEFCKAVLQLCAAADEACERVGVARASAAEEGDEEAVADYEFLQHAEALLMREDQAGGSSLCEHIHRSRARVLPKFRTSQRGLSLRSFSLHLSLCPNGEVEPVWRITPRDEEVGARNGEPGRGGDCLNLLLVPWPYVIQPSQFVPITGPTAMPDKYGLFSLTTAKDGHAGKKVKVEETVVGLLDSAARLVRHIDGVVLPELAVSPAEFDALARALSERKCFLIAGVSEEGPGGRLGSNYVNCSFPFGMGAPVFRQYKHHRWALDRSQIINYGLASRLDPNRVWWEGIEVQNRKLTFFALEDWLTLCVLICEDLARQDPVSEMVRTVGPNLVMALLMDGPQLQTRWPNRYATVLADDPGSAVLTLTSLGMARMSRPFGKPGPSQVIGLWRDAQTGTVEIDLPSGAGAVVLSLANEMVEEYTADRRSDEGTASALVLGGIHPVHLGENHPVRL